MTWGLWDNGGPWYVPFTILFLLFGHYCDFIETKSELDSYTLDIDEQATAQGRCSSKCQCDPTELSEKAKDWKVWGNDDDCLDCGKEYDKAKELIEMTQAFSCNEPGIS